MSITDELRKWARGFENVWVKPASKEIVVTTGTSMPVDHVNMRLFIEGMLDRIDAEHEAACAEAYGNGVMSVPIALDESTWVELPKDADGEYIHIGDVMEERSGHTFDLDGKQFRAPTELCRHVPDAPADTPESLADELVQAVRGQVMEPSVFHKIRDVAYRLLKMGGGGDADAKR